VRVLAKFIDNLLGKIGNIDVNEISEAVNYLIQKGLCDLKCIAVQGGSYGGFLTAVLIAKYPQIYKCAIMRNPAISLSFLSELSDIPEWISAEVFGTGLKI